MQQLVILGGGFAGVWAALAAAKVRERHAPNASDVAIVLVSRDRWLTIRPRLYEASLDEARVDLDTVLAPAGVVRVEGDVLRLDSSARAVMVHSESGSRLLRYDRLVLALGSHVHRAVVDGQEHAFSVDTYADAKALQEHLEALARDRTTSSDAARLTAVVVGAGFTGLEVATELVTRLRAAVGARARVVLVESAGEVAPDLGSGARGHVREALSALDIEARPGTTVSAIAPSGVRLHGGEWISAATTVWTGGFRASRLAEQLPVARDALGRVPVDSFLRVKDVSGVYAAGDVARAMADEGRVAPMSCQHAIPMGERAGANAMSELLGVAGSAYRQADYVTCLDLGEAGALFMQGWEREVRLSGFWAKLMKQTINTRLIYPPYPSPASSLGSALPGRSAA